LTFFISVSTFGIISVVFFASGSCTIAFDFSNL